jgi:hypothetical protein
MAVAANCEKTRMFYLHFGDFEQNPGYLHET